jgi:hypothetical protein
MSGIKCRALLIVLRRSRGKRIDALVDMIPLNEPDGTIRDEIEELCNDAEFVTCDDGRFRIAGSNAAVRRYARNNCFDYRDQFDRHL